MGWSTLEVEDTLMLITRRSFLKSLAALAGISAVPSLGVLLPANTEPVKWIVEENDYNNILGVSARWANGLRNAVMVNWPADEHREFAIESCKQALRQWYVERGTLKKVA